MAYKTLIFGTDDIYHSLKPFYDVEVKRGNLEIVAHAEIENGKVNLVYADGREFGDELVDIDIAIISSRQFFYERMKMLEKVGFPRNKIIDGTVFIVPKFDFPQFMKERVAHGFLDKTIFNLCVQTIYPQIYKIRGRSGSLSMDMLSYINGGSEFVGNGEVTIKKFCPIARKTTFELGENRDHSYRNVSTAPSWYFGHENSQKFLPPQTMCKIDIGNDVWIGWGSILKANNPNKPLVIGDGAVIASNSVVVKSVPPYAIVGGNPAQIIKYRFPKKIIRELLKICWWDWDLDKLHDNFKYFNDIETFVSMHKK